MYNKNDLIMKFHGMSKACRDIYILLSRHIYTTVVVYIYYCRGVYNVDIVVNVDAGYRLIQPKNSERTQIRHNSTPSKPGFLITNYRFYKQDLLIMNYELLASCL